MVNLEDGDVVAAAVVVPRTDEIDEVVEDESEAPSLPIQ